MKVLSTIEEMSAYSREAQRRGQSLGLVPTMGALHEGHLTLMRRARSENDLVLASVFVNPTQFAPNEDYDAYPRQFDEDCAKLAGVGVDAVFHPTPAEMYPEGYCTFVNVEGGLTRVLCGASRPIHFRGVATVVTKLMLLSRAERAYFGQKDAQQVCVVRRFVRDLNIPTEVVMVPICREECGLARSSRNKYLSAAEHEAALVLWRSLRAAQGAYENGERDAAKLVATARTIIAGEPMAEVEYVELRSFPELEPLRAVDQPALLALAVRFGKTRLIDNIILGGD